MECSEKTGACLQLRSCTFFHCTISIYDPHFMVVAVSCPKVFFRKWYWCRDLASNGSDNKGSLEEHFFHLPPIQYWHLCDQQDYNGGFQEDQNHETNATGHAMSHQQWENVFLNTHWIPLSKLEATRAISKTRVASETSKAHILVSTPVRSSHFGRVEACQHLHNIHLLWACDINLCWATFLHLNPYLCVSVGMCTSI